MNLSTWRTAIVGYLETAYPAAQIRSGERIGSSVVRDKDFITVSPGVLRADANVNNANATLTITYWVKQPKLGGNLRDVPNDPAALEAVMASLAATLQPRLASTGGMDYFHVQSMTPDSEEMGVEVVLVGWGRNPAESGG